MEMYNEWALILLPFLTRQTQFLNTRLLILQHKWQHVIQERMNLRGPNIQIFDLLPNELSFP